MLQVLPERFSGDNEAGWGRKPDSTQADKAHGFWPDYRFISEPGGIQWNNVNLTNNKNSLQMMHSSVRLQDCCYKDIITQCDNFSIQ